MAWYAQLKRIKWYCINGFDAIAWYSDKLYREWWDSLTEEEQKRIRTRREERKRKEKKEAMRSLACLMATCRAVSEMTPGGNFYI